MTAQLLRFCIVGAAGFVVDAAILLLVTAAHVADPISGRLISFSVAVCVTFALNCHWTFDGRTGHVAAQFARYLGVQGVGFAINLSVYTALYLLLPASLKAPLLCITVASACALLANFAGAKLVVFNERVGSAD